MAQYRAQPGEKRQNFGFEIAVIRSDRNLQTKGRNGRRSKGLARGEATIDRRLAGTGPRCNPFKANGSETVFGPILKESPEKRLGQIRAGHGSSAWLAACFFVGTVAFQPKISHLDDTIAFQP